MENRHGNLPWTISRASTAETAPAIVLPVQIQLFTFANAFLKSVFLFKIFRKKLDLIFF